MLRVLTRQPSSQWFRFLLFASAIGIFSANEIILAQSGRRPKTTAATPSPQVSEPVDSKTVAQEQILYVIIGGHDIDPDTKESWSTQVSTVVKACTAQLKEPPQMPFEIKNGGKMTKTEAIERAKRETDAYVLWFGYRTQLIGLEYQMMYMDYVVLKPKSASTLTEGRIDFRTSKQSADPGGVLRLPRGQTRSRSQGHILENGGREMADRVRNKL